MATVDVTVNGHSYNIDCNDGEEEHLKDLARVVDGKMTELTAALGQIGDLRLLLMVALLIADERMDAEAKLAQCADLQARLDAAEGKAAETLEVAARRVEAVTGMLAQK
jgi:cell division protein ZapA